MDTANQETLGLFRHETLRGLQRPSTRFGAFLVFLFLNGAAAAQDAKPVLRAGSISSPHTLDGRLLEPDWMQAESIGNLTQVEPVEGGAPTGRTVVRVLAGSSELLIGIEADDPDPSAIVAFSVQPDSNLRDEDHVRVVLDTFASGRSGVVFAVNPRGARYDALVTEQGDDENDDWDAIWEAKTARTPSGWSAEMRIPIRSLSFDPALRSWGFNVQRRIQRLQETDRWASPVRDYEVTQTSRAGVLTGLPEFDVGLGLSARPYVSGGFGVDAPGAPIDGVADTGLDVTKRLGGLESTLTINTDFGETEVDTRQVNLTRFPLFFPEKREFFLQGADIFDFGLGLGSDLVPFFSRRIGLLEGMEVPIEIGGKLSGRVGRTSIGSLVTRTGEVDIAPATTLAAVRIKRDVLAESSLGGILTAGDPTGLDGSWLAGGDFTYQTSHLGGDKNFLVGFWGLVMNRSDLSEPQTAFGAKIDYPNDLWDAFFSYRRIGDDFSPSLGFVRRPGTHQFNLGVDYSPRPGWPWVRQMFFEHSFSAVTDLSGRLESWRLFTAPVNWRLESGDRFEFNIVPEGERLFEPFEVSDGVVIPPGSYDWTRFRLEAETASKRKLSAEVTWWFGGFFGGTLQQFEFEANWNPHPLLTVDLSGEHNLGSLPQGDFTEDLVQARFRLNISPDLSLSSFIQYDNESESVGSNTTLRWRFRPAGELFVVHNNNLRVRRGEGLGFESARLLIKIQYEFRR